LGIFIHQNWEKGDFFYWEWGRTDFSFQSFSHIHTLGLGLWCFNTTFNNISVNRGSRFYWWRKPEYQGKKLTCGKSVSWNVIWVVLNILLAHIAFAITWHPSSVVRYLFTF